MRISDWSSDVCSSDLVAATVCIVALVFQMVDSNAAGKRFRARLARAPQWSSPLRSAVWNDVASRYRNIIVVLPHNASPDWVPLSRFAADHGMAINTGYFARIHHGRGQEAGRRIPPSIMEDRKGVGVGKSVSGRVK